jgi:hypothetical protein
VAAAVVVAAVEELAEVAVLEPLVVMLAVMVEAAAMG